MQQFYLTPDFRQTPVMLWLLLEKIAGMSYKLRGDVLSWRSKRTPHYYLTQGIIHRSGEGEKVNVADLAVNNIHEFGEYEQLVWREQVYTNVRLMELSRKLAGSLRELGVKKDDRVAIVLGNRPEAIIAFNAIAWIGAWSTPIQFLRMPAEIGSLLAHSEARVVITQRLWLNKILEARPKAPGVEHIILVDPEDIGEEEDNLLSFPDLIENSDGEIECEQTEEDDVALLIYTAGTTGAPRGVMLTHLNIISNVESLAAALRFETGEVSLGTLPLYHAYGIMTQLCGYLYKARTVLMSWFQPEKALSLIEQHRVTTTAVVPTMLIQMLNLPYHADYDASSVKRWVCAAAPLRVDLLHDFEAAFEGKILEGYGLTEAGPAVTINRPSMPCKPGSTGQPLPGVDVEIRDMQERPLPTGRKGEICVRGPNVMKGYFKDREATEESIREGRLRTGDAGYFDEDGYLYITERIKDLIIRGGENIFPKDIEKVLLEHPDIAEVSVVGCYDELYGEEVMAVVVPKPKVDLTEEIVLEFCEGRLAKFQRPKKVVIAPMLPKNPLGKVLRRKLRQQYGEFPK